MVGRYGPQRVRYEPGSAPSPYPWTDACLGEHRLPLCPDPGDRDEGVSLEQLVIVLDQLFADARVSPERRPLLRRVRAAVLAALAALAGRAGPLPD